MAFGRQRLLGALIGAALVLGVVAAPPRAVADTHAAGRLTFTHDQYGRDQRTGGIYSVRSDAALEPITFSNGWESWYDAGARAWSPDGTRVATQKFHGLRSDMDIFVLGADGRGARNITDDRCGRDESPSWSPDGSQIAFIKVPCDSGMQDVSEVWVTNPDGSGAHRIFTELSLLDRVDWSPDGQKLLLSPYGIIVTPDGDVIQESFSLQDASSWDVENAAWSPDGGQIVFEGWVCPAGPHSSCPRGLYVANADGSAWRLLDGTASYGRIGWPAWSPDGARIAFHADDPEDSSYRHVYVVPVAGGEVQLAAQIGRKTDQEYPAWQPCPAGDCPAEKEAARTLLYVRGLYCLRDKVVCGFFASNQPEVTVGVTLFKRSNGRWVRFKRARINTTRDRRGSMLGRWAVPFDPYSGPCRIKVVVRYPGDATHLPSRASEKLRTYNC